MACPARSTRSLARLGDRLAWATVTLSAVVGCHATPLPLTQERARDPRPNIVLFMAEDLGPRLGAFGDPVAETPGLDQLAAEGTRFLEAFTTAGVCAPSRAAIITGVDQNRWGAGHMRAMRGGYVPAPPPDIKAFPELLRKAGYQTFNNGKTDYQLGLRLGGSLGGPVTPWDQPDSSDWNQRDPDRPFFAYINLGQTHESQVWPTFQIPNSAVTWALWPIRLFNHFQWPSQTNPEDVRVPPYYPDTITVRQDIARHYNNIATLDGAIQELLQKLDRDGLSENTVVIFTADHGDGLPRAKRWLYDSGLHVPLIVRWPGVTKPGSTNVQLISLIDLAPTILSMADVPAPHWMDGRVFLGPREATEPRFIFASRDRMDNQPDTVRAVRDHRFKYIRHFQPDQPYVLDIAFRNQMPMMRELLEMSAANQLEDPEALWFRPQRDQEELFDTERDPHEIRNLAQDPRYATKLRELRSVLENRLEARPDLGLLPEEQLRDRFFPTGEQPITAAPQIMTKGEKILIHAPTEGASVEFRLNEGRWQLYSKPLKNKSHQRIDARAQRYGWALSEVTTLENP